jgi:hypothetical protein
VPIQTKISVSHLEQFLVLTLDEIKIYMILELLPSFTLYTRYFGNDIF